MICVPLEIFTEVKFELPEKVPVKSSSGKFQRLPSHSGYGEVAAGPPAEKIQPSLPLKPPTFYCLILFAFTLTDLRNIFTLQLPPVFHLTDCT